MHFQQVCMTAMTFSAARGGALVNKLSIQSLHGNTKIVVEQNNQDPEGWYVSLDGNMLDTHYFPAVSTQEELLNTLAKAWEYNRQRTPHLSRFVEEPFESQQDILPHMVALRQCLRDVYHDEKGS